jgi:hypothetical protein
LRGEEDLLAAHAEDVRDVDALRVAVDERDRALREAREARELAVTSVAALVDERDRLAAAWEEEKGRLEDTVAVLADKCHVLMDGIAARGGGCPVSPVPPIRRRGGGHDDGGDDDDDDDVTSAIFRPLDFVEADPDPDGEREGGQPTLSLLVLDEDGNVNI